MRCVFYLVFFSELLLIDGGVLVRISESKEVAQASRHSNPYEEQMANIR